MELRSNNFSSTKYHEVFDYKLTKKELVKWQYKTLKEATNGVKNKSRFQREKYSKHKLIIAKRVAKLLSKIPTVKFVGITGALAMNNAGKNSDIDLMIITKSNTLWLTRLCVYCILITTSYILRKPRIKNERDALCLNMWLDENDLIWDKADRNLYTAHEIAQIVPLVNKNKTHEKFLWQNKWVLDFWPNAVEISSKQYAVSSMRQGILHSTFYILQTTFEHIAYFIQYQYMKSKISREVVTPTRAIFHPNDWGKMVIDKLSS